MCFEEPGLQIGVILIFIIITMNSKLPVTAWVSCGTLTAHDAIETVKTC